MRRRQEKRVEKRGEERVKERRGEERRGEERVQKSRLRDVCSKKSMSLITNPPHYLHSATAVLCARMGERNSEGEK